MSSADVPIFERGVWLGLALARGERISRRYVQDHYQVSPATAKRDLQRIDQLLGPRLENDGGMRRLLK
jgi:predicted DNA-binding transcriptional regulator YafY